MTDLNRQAENALLDEMEARVLGCLMEKQMTTPDYYPLTLNALVTACNQKTSRVPVMNLSPQQVSKVLSDLRSEGLATASSGGRADRFEQHLARKFHLTSKQRAVLCVLMLRGAHTLNEIRIHTDRMTEFADNEDVQETLTTMMQKEEPLVVLIPRGPGQREDRYMHVLCGMPEVAPVSTAVRGESRESARVAELEAEVAELQKEVERLQALLALHTGE